MFSNRLKNSDKNEPAYRVLISDFFNSFQIARPLPLCHRVDGEGASSSDFNEVYSLQPQFTLLTDRDWRNAKATS